MVTIIVFNCLSGSRRVGRPHLQQRKRGDCVVARSYHDTKRGDHFVALGMDEGSVRILNGINGSIRISFDGYLTGNGHNGPIHAIEIINPTMVASGGVDGTIRVWNLTKKKLQHVCIRSDDNSSVMTKAGVTCLAYDEARGYLLAGEKKELNVVLFCGYTRTSFRDNIAP